jgi:uncharacterized membrane protein (UPF0182 family)
MKTTFPDSDVTIIEVPQPKKRHWRRWLLLAIVVLLLLASRSLNVYISALWFGSLGYSAVYWSIFKIKTLLFFLFLISTIVIMRGSLWLVARTFAAHALTRRTIMVNNQPIEFSPAKFVKPISWIVSVFCALVFGFSMKEGWQKFAVYYHQAATNLTDPIFNKPLGFYLFSLPVYDLLSSWLFVMAIIVFLATLICSLLLFSQQTLTNSSSKLPQGISVSAISWALIPLLLTLALKTYLSRFPYLWEDHQTFSGVTYTEANYLLPALTLVAVGLVIAAVLAAINGLTKRGWRLLMIAFAIPLGIYIVGVVIVPAYVTSFIVKPNELGREAPYIEHNITWTRRAFGLDGIEQREFDAENSVEALNLGANKPTLENIRLWDLKALQDTLRQIQEIRTYYDFPDVDVDRYRVSGQERQMMVAAREMDVDKLPDASRNWINEKLIYTHGYGVTMNTANGFDAEGMPQFILSNMPIDSKAAEAKVTRPEIYFGQKTNTDVYVRTKQNEFDFPQGDTNRYTSYEGSGGIRIGSGLRRMLLAYALDDLTKLPFSDDVTSDSRVLIHRNIRELVDSIAPFLIYDNDPYIVVGDDGHLYWMIDAFTESATYPYSRHYAAGGNHVNYIRNSVKAVIDAYNGTVKLYVFDSADPLIATYRAMFPVLFQDASAMPTDLRAHVRYPESLIQVQGEVFGLYHTQNTKVFFQREDLWSVANQVGIDKEGKKKQEAIEPYFVLMQLPGEKIDNEFAIILPFTPNNRNNMIGWMAGRCDGENYGKLLVYNFPKSRLIDGPLQIEARVDQNAQLSGQFTLWNQQGSRVLRGHLLVIPIGRSLLYVEPIYLRAESSPMPELRLVVLAIQDKVGYGKSFDEAMTNLFGETPKPQAQETNNQQKDKGTEAAPSPSPSPGATALDAQQLILRAIQEFDDYQRLTAQGKLAEAGQKLEQHKRTLEELKRVSAKPK